MKVLALDASTEACSAALLLDEQVQERFEIAPREHAQLLLPMVRELLAEAGVGLAALDAIAVARGPGAFTGIRIAMSMAQGLALGADIAVAPVSTLAALALRNYRLHGAQCSLVVQDARMQEVYWALYRISGAGQPLLQGEEQVSPPQHVAADNVGANAMPAGNGWAVYPNELNTPGGAAPRQTLPHAEDVARLGAAMVHDGHAVPAANAQPSYVRDNVARKRSERREA